MAPPDWKQSGMDAAADAARESYRALGPRAQSRKSKHRVLPSNRRHKHKHGELGEDAHGKSRGVAERKLLRALGEPQATPGDPFANIPMTLCTFPLGKLEPRGDLFEHLRKPQPPP